MRELILLQSVKNYLREIIIKHTKSSGEFVKDESSFESLGIDSVVITEMNGVLENDLGELSKTLFFEFQSINELAQYLSEAYENKLRDFLLPRHEDKAISETQQLSSPVAAISSGKINVDLINKTDEIAIVGINGQFPQANSLASLWDNLKAAKDCITEVPTDRWDYKAIFNQDRTIPGSSYLNWGGFIEDYDKFDPLFFNISKLEAETLDPQERLFLQVVYNTLADAGYTRKSLAKNTVGVFVGAMWSQYQLYGIEFANAGSSYASIANRASYFFNFTGPSIALDTMCSSSLVTIHLACESIRKGECDYAIAGGVNITVHPNKYVFLSKTGFAATDGRCHSYGAGGDGYVPGDGVGALLLKPLDKAIADRDFIYAVIKGTAINHGGKANGYTVPNPKAQTTLIEKALEVSGFDARSVSYFEGHGTGTSLGDPIEIRGLTTAFRKYTNENQFCAIGSIKSNIGHLESAAGFAGVAKTLLQMLYKKLVPSIHAEVLNPNIDFANTPFYVQRDVQDWAGYSLGFDSSRQMTRRAGVSSFGAGGANACVMLEEYKNHFNAYSGSAIIILSADEAYQLEEYAKDLLIYLENQLPEFVAAYDKSQAGYQFFTQSMLEKIIKTKLAGILKINEDFIDLGDEISDYLNESEREYLFKEQLSLALGVRVNDVQFSKYRTLEDLSQSLLLLVQEHYKSLTNSNRTSLDPYLFNIAYTLQLGREARKERLAFVVDSIVELKTQLQDFIIGKNEAYFRGTANQVQESNDSVMQLIEMKLYKKLVKLWISGMDVNWQGLYYQNNCPTKMPLLPSYPFRKERCWVVEPKGVVRQQNVGLKDAKLNDEVERILKRFFYQPKWREYNFSGALSQGKKVLIFYSSEAALIKNNLKELYHSNQIYTCLLGQQTRVLANNNWELNVASVVTDLSLILAQMGEIDEIIYISYVSETFEPDDDVALTNSQQVGILPLIILVKNLAERYNQRKLNFGLITVNNWEVNTNDISSVYSSSIVGMVRAVAREYKFLRVKMLDLGVKANMSLSQVEKAIKRQLELFLPLLDINDGFQVFATRVQKIYQQVLEGLELATTIESPFKEHGVYLLIGGSGTVGRKLASYLAENYKSKLIIWGRRAQDPDIDKLVLDLEAKGSEVLYESIDIRNFALIEKHINSIEAKYGKLNGIFNLAMDFDVRKISELNIEDLDRFIGAKVQGTYNIQKALIGKVLDFMIIFSSTESFVGNIGWAAYTAACSFQDALGRYLAKNAPYLVKVVNWGFWEGSNRGEEEVLISKGIYPIKQAEGMAALEKILTHGFSQILALNVSDTVLDKIGVVNLNIQQVADVSLVSTAAVDQFPVIESKPVSEVNKIEFEVIVKTIIADVLKIDVNKIQSEEDLSTYGVDSLIIINIHTAFEDKLGKLPADFLLNNMNVSQIVSYLLDKHMDQLAQVLKKNSSVQSEKVEAGKPPVTEINYPGVNINLIDMIDQNQIGSFLESYGQRFKDKQLLIHEPKPVGITRIHDLKGKMAHLLIELEDKIKIEVVTAGEGEPILFIPAVALTAPVWYNQFQTMTNQYQLIVIHAPGYGLSSKIKELNTKGVSEKYIRVMEILGFEANFHIIASCFGGIAAQYLASHYQDKIRSLILCGAFYDNIGLPDINPELLSIEELFAMVKNVAGSLKADFDCVIAHLSDESAKARCEFFSSLLLNSQCADPIVAMKYLNELLTLNTFNWLKDIKCPTLCLTGDLDTVVNPKASSEISSAIRSSMLTYINGAGHYPFLTHADEFNKLVLEFILKVKLKLKE